MIAVAIVVSFIVVVVADSSVRLRSTIFHHHWYWSSIQFGYLETVCLAHPFNTHCDDDCVFGKKFLPIVVGFVNCLVFVFLFLASIYPVICVLSLFLRPLLSSTL